MARFNYKAVDAAGFPREGVVNATYAAGGRWPALCRQLDASLVDEERAVAGALGATAGELRQSDLVAFVREIATLLSSGVGLTETFSTLHDATKNLALQDALSRLIASVQGGDTFSVALRKAKLDLPEYVYALARAG